jgi:hypothetical protein
LSHGFSSAVCICAMSGLLPPNSTSIKIYDNAAPSVSVL